MLLTFKLWRLYLSNLFTSDPTIKWSPRGDVELVFDVFKRSINGICPGDRFDKLEIFGKPSDKNPQRLGTYIWRSVGLAADADRGTIEGFTLLFRDKTPMKSWKKFNPARIKMVNQGKITEFTERTTELDVRNFLGQPSEEESFDGVASILIYDFQRLRIMFQFDTDKRIKEFDIFDPHE